MSYIKQNFSSGDTLYASDLNKMDDQIYKNEMDINSLFEEIANLPTKSEIVGEVLTLIATPIAGTIDENNVISLGGELAEGTYTLRWFSQNDYVEICKLAVDSEGGITPPDIPDIPDEHENLLSTAKTPTDLSTIFNGVGYMDGKYASSASPYYGDDSATFCSGCIPCETDSVFYISGVTLDTANTHCRFAFAKVQNNAINNYIVTPINSMSNYANVEELGDKYYKVTLNAAYMATNCPDLQYMFFSAVGSGADCIVYKDEAETDTPVADPPNTTLVWEIGTKIDSSTGAETTGQTVYNASNYIEIVDGYTYTFSKSDTSATGSGFSLKVVYYDENKNFISTTSSNVIGEVTAATSAEIPLGVSGAKYFRLRVYFAVAKWDDALFSLTAEVSA